MNYDQLIQEYNNRFASGSPTQLDVSENRVYEALQELLLGTPVSGFGKIQLFSYPELYDEDSDTTLVAHEEFGFQPDTIFVEYLSGRFPTITIGNSTSREKLVRLMAESLAKGENVYLQGYGVWSVAKMAAFVDGGVLSPAGKYPVFVRDVSMYRRFNIDMPEMDKGISPDPQEMMNGVRQYSITVNGGWAWQEPYKPCLRRPPTLPTFTQAEFNAAVAANVAASLNAQVVPLQNQVASLQTQLAAAQAALATAQAQVAPLQANVTALQAQLASAQGNTTALQTQLASAQSALVSAQTQVAALQAQVAALQAAGGGNLQPLINAGLILQPQRRAGQYTIKDFTVLNAIYRAGAPTYFIKKDLDFINVQLLSIRQAVQKMYQVAVAKDNDLNTTAIYRTRANKRKEYSAKIDDDFKEFLLESVRVMNYAIDEVRFNQKFNLPSPTLVRDLDVLP
jgi:hypothetical protein